MERVESANLEADRAGFDQWALRTPSIDPFCSSTAWALSAHEAFHPEQEPYLFRGESSWLALARGESKELGRTLAPLEAMWGLSSPLVGEDPLRAAKAAIEALQSVASEWDTLWLSGLDAHGPAFALLAQHFHTKHGIFLGPATRRHVASLEGGLDGWLSRRSRRFRANLRKATNTAKERGVQVEWIAGAPDEHARRALFERALSVDDRSWKGLSKQGLRASEMAHFYDRMTQRLHEDQGLRVLFLRLDDQDIAMGFGGVFGGTFRGLQMSFDDAYRSYAPGNLVQAELIERLCEAGTERYDLGTDMGYKSRWAELGLETAALVVRRL